MKRGLFFFERFLLVGGRRPWNVILAVRTQAAAPEESMRAALDTLQRRHPMLGVGVVQDRPRPRFEPDAPPIELRMAPRADAHHWFRAIEQELEQPFDRQRGPLLRVTWLRHPVEPVSELLLVGDHCICDGRAMLLLAQELLHILGLPPPDGPDQPRRRIERLEDLFPDRQTGGRLVRHAGSIGWLLRGSGDVKRLLRWVRGMGGQTSGDSYVLRWDMEPEQSERLHRRCRTEDVTAYAAMAVALLRAVRTVRPKQARNRLLCPVDVRTHVPGLAPDMLFGFPETLPLSIERGLDRTFWQQARALRRDLVARKQKLDPGRTLMDAERLHGLSDWFISLQLHGRARNDLMFSYLGNGTLPVPDDRPADQVLAFLSSMPWRGTTAVFSVRDGMRLRFCLVARTASLPRAEAERIRDEAMARLDAAARCAEKPAVRPPSTPLRTR